MLTRWGCEVADNHGVPTFLQSSPAGYRTYEKCGFEEAYVTNLDLTNIGLDGVYRTWLMVRYPQVRSTIRCPTRLPVESRATLGDEDV